MPGKNVGLDEIEGTPFAELLLKDGSVFTVGEGVVALGRIMDDGRFRNLNPLLKNDLLRSYLSGECPGFEDELDAGARAEEIAPGLEFNAFLHGLRPRAFVSRYRGRVLGKEHKMVLVISHGKDVEHEHVYDVDNDCISRVQTYGAEQNIGAVNPESFEEGCPYELLLKPGSVLTRKSGVVDITNLLNPSLNVVGRLSEQDRRRIIEIIIRGRDTRTRQREAEEIAGDDRPYVWFILGAFDPIGYANSLVGSFAGAGDYDGEVFFANMFQSMGKRREDPLFCYPVSLSCIREAVLYKPIRA